MDRSRTKSSSAKTNQFVLSQGFSLGPLQIRYYGFTMLAAVASAYFLGRKHTKEIGVQSQDFDDIAFWTIIWGFLGARIYYVLFYFYQFQNDLSEIYKIWHGGISIYGGLIAGAIAIWYQCGKRDISFLKFTDKLIIGVPLGQAIGRIGNYLNFEAFGTPTNLPWKIFIPERFRPGEFSSSPYFHPTFAYEMIWDLIIFIILLTLNRKVINQKPGWLVLIYILTYSIGRLFIEGLRVDSAFIAGFKVDQIIALLLIIFSFGIILYRYVPQANK
jgi:phosphatidylglycerol---prolipoprotein diacylglyceryl transferase